MLDTCAVNWLQCMGKWVLRTSRWRNQTTESLEKLSKIAKKSLGWFMDNVETGECVGSIFRNQFRFLLKYLQSQSFKTGVLLYHIVAFDSLSSPTMLPANSNHDVTFKIFQFLSKTGYTIIKLRCCFYLWFERRYITNNIWCLVGFCESRLKAFNCLPSSKCVPFWCLYLHCQIAETGSNDIIHIICHQVLTHPLEYGRSSMGIHLLAKVHIAQWNKLTESEVTDLTSWTLYQWVMAILKRQDSWEITFVHLQRKFIFHIQVLSILLEMTDNMLQTCS